MVANIPQFVIKDSLGKTFDQHATMVIMWNSTGWLSWIFIAFGGLS